MEILEGTFKLLRTYKLAQSQYEYSTYWLGMSQSYYSALKASHASPSIAALTKLWARLDDRVLYLRSSRCYSISESLQKLCSDLDLARARVLTQIKTNCSESSWNLDHQ
jgi:hypothetical protein